MLFCLLLDIVVIDYIYVVLVYQQVKTWLGGSHLTC
jgi:hypothetical protein